MVDGSVLERQRREEAQVQREFQAIEAQGRWQELGRAALGFVQRDRRSEGLGWTWEPGHHRTGLPAGFPRRAVDAATAAVEREVTAARALEQAIGKARAWADKYRPSPELLKIKVEELTIEPQQALREASAVTEQAVVELGAELDAWQQAHEVLSQVTGRRAAAERAHQAALAAIDRDVKVAESQIAAIKAGVQLAPPLVSPALMPMPTL